MNITNSVNNIYKITLMNVKIADSADLALELNNACPHNSAKRVVYA
jgi:hypothetical protein